MIGVPIDAVQQVGGAEAEPDACGDARELPGREIGDTLGERARAASAQRLDQQPGLDADRTRRRAEPQAAQVSMPW